MYDALIQAKSICGKSKSFSEEILRLWTHYFDDWLQVGGSS